AASLRGAGRGALARHRASRYQAGELLRHATRRRLAVAQGARFRNLEDLDQVPTHCSPSRTRYGRIHVARADAVVARRGSSQRYLVAGHRALRAVSGNTAFRRRLILVDGAPGRERTASPADGPVARWP